jgi:hypothetical protein
MQATEGAYRKLSRWVGNCLNSAVSLAKITLLACKAPRLDTLRNSAINRCVVLGSGPSLTASLEHYMHETEVSFLAVNTFVFSDAFEKVKPEFYVILDPGMWLADHSITRNTLAMLQQKTTWKLRLMIPHSARKSAFVQSLETHPFIQVVYLNYIVFKGFTSLAHRYYRKNKAMPQSQNVLVAALFLAVNLGFKRVELLGADHDWHRTLAVNDENVVCVKQVHFYEQEQEVKLVPFKKGLHSGETFRMDEIFFAWAKVFYGYHTVRQYAVEQGTTILNATPGSFVDAFERITHHD